MAARPASEPTSQRTCWRRSTPRLRTPPKRNQGRGEFRQRLQSNSNTDTGQARSRSKGIVEPVGPRVPASPNQYPAGIIATQDRFQGFWFHSKLWMDGKFCNSFGILKWARGDSRPTDFGSLPLFRSSPRPVNPVTQQLRVLSARRSRGVDDAGPIRNFIKTRSALDVGQPLRSFRIGLAREAELE